MSHFRYDGPPLDKVIAARALISFRRKSETYWPESQDYREHLYPLAIAGSLTHPS
jgi:hypothetical protein